MNRIASPRANWILTIPLLVVVAVAYLPALRNGFVSDDLYLIAQRSEAMKSPGALNDLLSNSYWWGTDRKETREYIYRPWISFTYWFEYQIGGDSPVVYHASNYLVHLANSGLLTALLISLCGVSLGVTVAALVALSPAGLTSVGWIAGRTDLWATLFSLLFLILFRKGRATGRAGYHVAAALSWFLALGSKEIALISPALALLLDFVSPARTFEATAQRRAVIISYGYLALPLAANILLRKLTVGTARLGSFSFDLMLSKLPIWPEQYLRSAAHVLLPFHYNFYSELAWSKSGSGPVFILGWLLFLALIALIVWGIRRRALWAMGGVWFGLVLFPVYILGQSWAVQADFYSYLALPGLWLFVADGVRTLAARAPAGMASLIKLWRAPLIAILAVFAILIFVRLPILNGERTLWSHMATRMPASAKPVIWLAQTYFDESDSVRGLSLLRQAIKVDSTDWVPHYRLAKWYLNQDDARHAAPHIEALTNLATMEPDALILIAYYAYLVGRCDIAAATYEQAFTLQNATPEQRFDYGLSLMCLNRIPEAVPVYQQVVSERPKWAFARANLASCYDLLGRLEEAEREFREAIRLDSTLGGAWAALALVQVRLGRPGDAALSATRFVALNPEGGTAAQQRAELAKAGLLPN